MTGRKAPERAPETVWAGSEPAGSYQAIHAMMARWLRIPTEPPALPEGHHEEARSFRPAESWLRYLKIQYFIRVAVLGGLLGGLGVALFIGLASDGKGTLAVVLALLLGVPIGLWIVSGWWAIQLRFDTTWYVMTDRALRVRTGIWTIREQTVTFENAQNVRVRRGPLQRFLGIGDVSIETAAAGQSDGQGTTTASSANLQGVAAPEAIRNRIVDRMRQSRSAGLGDGGESRPARDERRAATAGGGIGGFRPAHVEVLRQIRTEVETLASR